MGAVADRSLQTFDAILDTVKRSRGVSGPPFLSVVRNPLCPSPVSVLLSEPYENFQSHLRNSRQVCGCACGVSGLHLCCMPARLHAFVSPRLLSSPHRVRRISSPEWMCNLCDLQYQQVSLAAGTGTGFFSALQAYPHLIARASDLVHVSRYQSRERINSFSHSPSNAYSPRKPLLLRIWLLLLLSIWITVASAESDQHWHALILRLADRTTPLTIHHPSALPATRQPSSAHPSPRFVIAPAPAAAALLHTPLADSEACANLEM